MLGHDGYMPSFVLLTEAKVPMSPWPRGWPETLAPSWF
ncbi:hypothetical protein DFAR_3850036 [Desulfarculales bacterium]